MKKMISALMLAIGSVPTIASEMQPAAGSQLMVSTPQNLPYEIMIGSGCPYSYDHMSSVVERAFYSKGIKPLWENDSHSAAADLYLSISVECRAVTERNKTYTTSIQFARYDESPLAHSVEYGKDGYGSDRLFTRRLGESVDGALKVFLQVNEKQG